MKKLAENCPSPHGNTLRFLNRQHDEPTANTVEHLTNTTNKGN